MTNQNWVSLINPASAQSSGAGAALSTAATATLSPTTGSTADVAQVNPEGQYQGWEAGMKIRVSARLFVTTVSTAGTLTFFLASRVGNAGSTYVTLATTSAVSTPAAANTGIQGKIEAFIRCTGLATSGNTVSTQGEVTFGALAGQTILTATAQVWVGMPNASGETAAAVDTTQLQGISLRCTQATSTCTVQATQWVVEMMD